MNVTSTEQFIFKINGRSHYLNRIVHIHKVGHATWRGTTIGGISFAIEGGKAAGGSARDWFLDIDGNTKAIICTSFVDAIKCINNA